MVILKARIRRKPFLTGWLTEFFHTKITFRKPVGQPVLGDEKRNETMTKDGEDEGGEESEMSRTRSVTVRGQSKTDRGLIPLAHATEIEPVL